MKYAIMKQFMPDHNKSLMSRAMEVTRQGFNKWLRREKSPQKQRRDLLTELIADTYEEFEGVYGAPRITDELNELGHHCSENYVAKLMSELGIRARNGKGFKYPRHALSMNNVSDNLLWRDFTATRPNEKWTSDITYIWVENRWMYLAVVMDLFSRRIVGWSLDTDMTEHLIEEALKKALAQRDTAPGLLVHSDRGVQYRAQKYIDVLLNNNCRISMSRKGNCWDNAPMESFFSRLKVELIYRKNFQTHEELKTGIFSYIEVFYNRKRRHSANCGISPAVYEERAALAA